MDETLNDRLYGDGREEGKRYGIAVRIPIKERLSESERMLVYLIATGCMLYEAAYRMNVSRSTISNMTQAIRHKLEAKTLSHAIALAVHYKIVVPIQGERL